MLVAQRAVQDGAAADPGAVARAVLARSEFQTELPVTEAAANLAVPGLPVLGLLVELLLYVLLAVTLVLIVTWIVREFVGAPDAAAADGEELGPAKVAGEPGALLADPERLAGAGRFQEAIHMLLLVAIRYLSRELPSPPHPSSTSRELLRELPMSEEAEDAFRHLVDSVEVSLFGGIEATADDYAGCRRSFRALIPEGSAP